MNDACYCSSNGKIYGTVGPYVCQYNGTTGERENFFRIGSPVYGDMRICYHAATDKLYVAAWHEPDEQNFAPLTWPQRDVFEVNLALTTSTALGLGALEGLNPMPPYTGYRWIASSGIYLYVSVSGTPNYYIRRVDPANIADTGTTSNFLIFSIEQAAISPTQVVVPRPGSQGLRYYNLALGGETASSLVPYSLVGMEYNSGNGLFYGVTGDTNLIRVDVLTPIAFTVLNLGALEATADPCRIRYWSGTGRLYLPCMTANGVIVWNPNTESGEFKSGFNNPVDCVFTGSKSWAVQNAPIGLREIV